MLFSVIRYGAVVFVLITTISEFNDSWHRQGELKKRRPYEKLLCITCSGKEAAVLRFRQAAD